MPSFYRWMGVERRVEGHGSRVEGRKGNEIRRWLWFTIIPPGLRPGDMYHLVFVTEAFRDAASSEIGVYNTFVNDQAAGPGLRDFMWFAIASTQLVDARDNALISAPVYRLDGTKVADGFVDIWDGSLDAPISFNQFGEFTNAFVWTGTLASGLAAPTHTLGSLTGPLLGLPSSVAASWIDTGFVQEPTAGSPMYALSGKLTVPVPEPSSQTCVWLMLLCAGTAYGWQPRFSTEPDTPHF